MNAVIAATVQRGGLVYPFYFVLGSRGPINLALSDHTESVLIGFVPTGQSFTFSGSNLRAVTWLYKEKTPTDSSIRKSVVKVTLHGGERREVAYFLIQSEEEIIVDSEGKGNIPRDVLKQIKSTGQTSVQPIGEFKVEIQLYNPSPRPTATPKGAVFVENQMFEKISDMDIPSGTDGKGGIKAALEKANADFENNPKTGLRMLLTGDLLTTPKDVLEITFQEYLCEGKSGNLATSALQMLELHLKEKNLYLEMPIPNWEEERKAFLSRS